MNAEKQAAIMLLKKGVALQIKAPFFFRIFGKKRIGLKLRLPTLHTLLCIAEEYLSVGVDVERELSLREALEITLISGRMASRVVAMAMINKASLLWLTGLLGRQLRKSLMAEELKYLYHLTVVYGGVEDFIATIRLIQKTRITKPNLSQREKGS